MQFTSMILNIWGLSVRFAGEFRSQGEFVPFVKNGFLRDIAFWH